MPIRKADGTHYRWRMFYDQRRKIVEADHLTELMSALFPNYLNLSERHQLGERVRIAHNVQAFHRINLLLLLDATTNADIEDWEFQILINFTPVPAQWSAKHPNVWKCKVPLVLVRTDYSPYAHIEPPVSDAGMENIVWLDPATETSLLQDLHSTGYITLEKL